MKYLFLALLFGSLASNPAFAGKEGFGGGGVTRSGVYTTFGSTGFFIDPQPVTDVPGLDLVESILKDTLSSYDVITHYLELLHPGGARQYFNVQSIDPAMLANLKNELSRVTGQPPAAIVVYAFTDKEKRITYLLPEFYRLADSSKPKEKVRAEQAAIIFHEFDWLADPSATYDKVVRIETSFQRLAEKKLAGQYDPDFGKKIVEQWFGSQQYQISLNMDLMFDGQSGSLSSLGPNGQSLYIEAIAHPDAITSCRPLGKQSVGQYLYDTYEMIFEGPAENNFLYQQANRYSSSFFLKNLSNYLAPNSSGRSGKLVAIYFSKKFGMPINSVLSPEGCRNVFLGHGWGVQSGQVLDPAKGLFSGVYMAKPGEAADWHSATIWVLVP